MVNVPGGAGCRRQALAGRMASDAFKFAPAPVQSTVHAWRVSALYSTYKTSFGSGSRILRQRLPTSIVRARLIVLCHLVSKNDEDKMQ